MTGSLTTEKRDASINKKWALLPTGLLLIATLALFGGTFSSTDDKPSVRSRELLISCVTDEQCPKLYCPAEPCTVFECRNNECLITIKTSAETAAPVTTAPVTAAPVSTAPVTPAPVTTAPVTVSPVTTAPVTVSPVTTAPATTAPATSAPATAPPATTAPQVESAPAFAGNDVCSKAVGPIPITAQGLGDSRAIITRGTTSGAATPTSFAPTCNNIPHTGPGVWYKVTGTGARMTASTCWLGSNYDTAINVYTASRRRDLKKDEDDKDEEDNGNPGGAAGGGCSSLQCVNANDDASGNFGQCRVNSILSRVQWESVRGETYYLLVHGFWQKTGDFDLNVITHRPLNEECGDATTIPISDETIVGTTFQAKLPWGPNQATNCGGAYGLIGDTASVWYKVTSPTTRMLEASTCHPLTNFDTKVHIFQGSCSSSGGCLGGNDNHNSPNRCSLTTWQAQAGTAYYILVHAFRVDMGLFELSVRGV